MEEISAINWKYFGTCLFKEKVHSMILLYLSGEVIIEVIDQETAVGLWKKIGNLVPNQVSYKEDPSQMEIIFSSHV